MKHIRTRRGFIVLRFIILVLIIAGLVAMCIATFFLGYQKHLIYHPRPYPKDWRPAAPPELVLIPFSTSAGSQTAFYLPPAQDPTRIPDTLWVFFHGNGSLGLEWTMIAQQCGPRTGALMVDYPGFGLCQGEACPKTVRETIKALMPTAAKQLHFPEKDLVARSNVTGYSFGAAVALEFAARYPVRKVLLIAPFASTGEMANAWFAPPADKLLMHDYDSLKRMDELAKRPSPPRVMILHGAKDQIIPVAQARELARRQPAITKYIELPDADHGTIESIMRPRYIEWMRAK